MSAVLSVTRPARVIGGPLWSCCQFSLSPSDRCMYCIDLWWCLADALARPYLLIVPLFKPVFACMSARVCVCVCVGSPCSFVSSLLVLGGRGSQARAPERAQQPPRETTAHARQRSADSSFARWPRRVPSPRVHLARPAVRSSTSVHPPLFSVSLPLYEAAVYANSRVPMACVCVCVPIKQLSPVFLLQLFTRPARQPTQEWVLRRASVVARCATGTRGAATCCTW